MAVGNVSPSVRRGLTLGEIALARQAFGHRLPYGEVRFVDGADGNFIAKTAFRNGNGAITLRRTIFFGNGYYLPDFSVAKAAAKGLFIHEMTHVWQYLTMGTPLFLARYAREFAAAGFKPLRMYEYEPGKTAFRGAMLEAQAEMAGNYAEAKADVNSETAALIARNLKGSGLFQL